MVSNTQIKAALDEYCKSSEGYSWEFSDGHGRKRFVIRRPNACDVYVWQEAGKFRCSDKDVGMVLVEMASGVADRAADMDMTADALDMTADITAGRSTENLPVSADRSKPASRSKSNDPAEDKVLAEDKALVEFHRKRARTYRTEDGCAPTAAMVNRNANRHRFCTEVLEYVVTDELVRAKVRVTDPITGQYKEDGVAFTRNALIAKKTVDIISKHIKKNPSLVVSVDPVTMRPELSDTAMIYDMPAKLFVAKEILKSWNFLGRFAITTAERRCQDKLLNAEWREKEEIELERCEIEDVAEAV
jgi:hypothetical protein